MILKKRYLFASSKFILAAQRINRKTNKSILIMNCAFRKRTSIENSAIGFKDGKLLVADATLIRLARWVLTPLLMHLENTFIGFFIVPILP
jgi:hypothetical protein